MNWIHTQWRALAWPTWLAMAAVALMVGAAPAAGPVPADKVETVTVEVSGAGMDKAEAMSDAKRKAVERGAGTYIYSQSKTKDFVLVKDTVLARAAGFVEKVTVISGPKEMEDGTWEVKIRAVVSVKGIRDTWGVVKNLLGEMGRPKIMVFIVEKVGDEVQESSTVQTRIERILLKSGFDLVDRKQIKAIQQRDMASAIAENKPEKVQALAKQFGAQLFITGVAKASFRTRSRNYGGMYSYEATSNVRCYRSDSGKLLSAVPGNATVGSGGTTDAAAKLALDWQAKLVAPKVQYDILRFWQDVVTSREVTLVIDKISFRDYLQVKKALSKMKSVKEVLGNKYNNKVGTYQVMADCTAAKLAEAIAESFEAVEITDLSQNVIKGTWGGS